jgi:hypothetical protein
VIGEHPGDRALAGTHSPAKPDPHAPHATDPLADLRCVAGAL